MTPEQRYMMDAQGFVILRGAMSDAEVEAGRAVSWLCRRIGTATVVHGPWLSEPVALGSSCPHRCC